MSLKNLKRDIWNLGNVVENYTPSNLGIALQDLCAKYPESEDYVHQVGEMILTEADGSLCHVVSDVHTKDDSLQFIIQNPDNEQRYVVSVKIEELP